jgi:SAM-dependent methyltransferase
VNSNAERIFARYNSTPDYVWKELIGKSAIDPMINGIAFPLVPDEATQCHFVGSTLAKNVNEPYRYYEAVKNTYVSRFGSIDKETKLLDVGSGWGRIIRFFMKDIAPSNLSGCDVSSQSIDICNTCFRGELNFQLIKTLPPTPYEDNCFDIVEGYSVFTHLSYYAVVLWMDEYFRILKPGGMLAMTIWHPRRFDHIRKIQGEPPRSPESGRYHYMLQTSFSQGCILEEDLYRKTGFVYIPYSTDPEITYGEAFIAPDILVQQWSAFFEYITTYELDVDQQIIFLRKRPTAHNMHRETLRETAKVAKMIDVQSICVNTYNKEMRSKMGINYDDTRAGARGRLKISEALLAEKTRQVQALLDSASWRVTRPLRRAYEIALKLKNKK